MGSSVTARDLRGFYEAYLARCNEHRFDALEELIAPDVIVNGAATGRRTYIEGLRAVVAGFDDYHWQLERVLVDGEWLSAVLLDTGTHTGARWGIPATGHRVATHELASYHVVAGLISEVWVAADDIRVIEQLQLR